MKNNHFTKRWGRVLLAVMMLSTCFMCFSGITAFAAVDLDVTLVPPADSVTNSGDCEVQLEILTKSDNGYVEMLINIEYDEDLMRLAAPVNQNGYRVVGSKGQLTLNYTDPTGTNTPTPIGNKEVISIHFTVLEDAPDTTTKVKATVHHAYNKRGKNITWTPIYDKTIEIVRINQDVNNDDTSSEEVSSQFVVGDPNVKRSNGVDSGNAGKIAAVVIGAIVIFSAGMAVGNIFCMKRYGLSFRFKKKGSEEDGYEKYEKYDDYDDYDKPDARRGRSRRKNDYDEYDDYDDYYEKYEKDDRYEESDSYGKYEGGSEDGFYKKPGEDYTVGDDDDYLTAVPVSKTSGDSFPDIFGNTSPIGSRSLDPSDFSNLFGTSAPSEKAAQTGRVSANEDDYPALFASARKPEPRQAPAAPTFDNDEDSIFGRFTANVERNVDDGYGGISASRSRDRSERSPRNR